MDVGRARVKAVLTSAEGEDVDSIAACLARVLGCIQDTIHMVCWDVAGARVDTCVGGVNSYKLGYCGNGYKACLSEQ